MSRIGLIKAANPDSVLADNPPKLVSSDWYVYRHPRWKKKNDKTLVIADLTGSGEPLIYGASRLFIIGIELFDIVKIGTDNAQTAGKLSTTLSVTVSQGTPANLTDFGALISGLAGISAQSLGSESNVHPAYVAAACQQGTASLPFTAAITQASLQNANADPQKGGAPQTPNPGTTACSGNGNTTPCSMSRNFTSQDREYWDVGIGIATPGLRETSYSFSNASGTVSPSVTTHAEVYGLFDIFPFGRLVPKESIIPHFALGVPVTTKSFYRPFFGLSENLTGWTHAQKKLKLPVGINFLAGVSFMKTQEINGLPVSQAQFQSALGTHRVWKGMFGFEVPVSSLASKLSGKSGSGSKGGK